MIEEFLKQEKDKDFNLLLIKIFQKPQKPIRFIQFAYNYKCLINNDMHSCKGKMYFYMYN